MVCERDGCLLVQKRLKSLLLDPRAACAWVAINGGDGQVVLCRVLARRAVDHRRGAAGVDDIKKGSTHRTFLGGI